MHVRADEGTLDVGGGFCSIGTPSFCYLGSECTVTPYSLSLTCRTAPTTRFTVCPSPFFHFRAPQHARATQCAVHVCVRVYTQCTRTPTYTHFDWLGLSEAAPWPWMVCPCAAAVGCMKRGRLDVSALGRADARAAALLPLAFPSACVCVCCVLYTCVLCVLVW